MEPLFRSASVVEMTSKDNDPTTTMINTYDYYDALLQEKIAEQKQKLVMFENLIAIVKSETNRAIMRYYYAQGWTDEQIALEVNLEADTVGKKRRTTVYWLVRNNEFDTKIPVMSGTTCDNMEPGVEAVTDNRTASKRPKQEEPFI